MLPYCGEAVLSSTSIASNRLGGGGLQAWQMAPYVEAVLRQQRSHPLLRASAKLLQARHERTRTRTLERSLMHLQQVAEGAGQALPATMTRFRCAMKRHKAAAWYCEG